MWWWLGFVAVVDGLPEHGGDRWRIALLLAKHFVRVRHKVCLVKTGHDWMIWMNGRMGALLNVRTDVELMWRLM
jgi:hypothetical protein